MAVSDSKEDGLPDYGAPPLVEVACGLQFARLDPMRIPHYGLFWQEIRNDFPHCEHAAPLGEFPGQLTSAEFPLPRVWFINEVEDTLIQLQNDRIVFNWRRLTDDHEYPRFDYVIKSFRQYLDLFIKFADANDLGSIAPVAGELTYVNQILEGSGWETPADLGNVMEDLSWKTGQRFLPEPQLLDWTAAFSMPDGAGTLSTRLRLGQRRSDSKRMLLLELGAKGLGKEKDLQEIWPWYDLAHKWIVKGFADLTTDNIQQHIWGRR